MTYNASYTSDDYDDIIFDLSGTILAKLTENAGLIVTVIILGLIVVLVGKTIKISLGLVGNIKM